MDLSFYKMIFSEANNNKYKNNEYGFWEVKSFDNKKTLDIFEGIYSDIIKYIFSEYYENLQYFIDEQNKKIGAIIKRDVKKITFDYIKKKEQIIKQKKSLLDSLENLEKKLKDL